MADDLDTFRAETRAWLEANCPAEMREPMRDESDACWGGRNPSFKNEAQKLWLDRMAARGWTVPDWPTEYGGGGPPPARTQKIPPGKAPVRGAQPPPNLRPSLPRPA